MRSGFMLKTIAVVTMLVDHIGATIVLSWLQLTQDSSLVLPYYIMRGIGRMAFPLYCFLLVEGFLHTRSQVKYALRLGAFALLSEIPFDLAFEKTYWYPKSNNVFFTLFIAILVLIGIRYIQEHPQLKNRIWLQIPAVLLTCGVGFVAAKWLHTDYGGVGVAAVVIIYLFRKWRCLAFGLGVLVLCVLAGEIEALAFFMLIPVYFYDGTRGPQSKYFFYLFYPVHLLLLAGICSVIVRNYLPQTGMLLQTGMLKNRTMIEVVRMEHNC